MTSATTETVPHPLVVRTVAVDDPARDDDLATLIGLLPRDGAFAWVRRGDGLVGWGEALRIETRGPDRFAQAQDRWREALAGVVVRDEVGMAGTGPVAFGSFSFDDDGDGVLLVPRVVVGRRGGTTWLTTIDTAATLGPAPTLDAHLPGDDPVDPPGPVTFADGQLPTREWPAVVRRAVEEVRDGRVEKVVIARDLVAQAAEPIDTRWLLRRLAREYPSCWTFQVGPMLGATPELLVRAEKGLVTSRVLAGTIRRTGDDEADLARAAILAHSSKDLEEHEYAVESVAHALEPYCSSTNVPEVPFVLHLANVLHLATDVTAVLDGDHSSLSLAAALHPSAAVCGTPTPDAKELIGEIEGLDRARYAGPVGWLDADGDGEWGIALRSAEIDPDDPSRLRLFAGCGIVAASDPSSELAESEAKLEPMRFALRED